MTKILTIFRFTFLWSQLFQICVTSQCEMSGMQTSMKNNMRFKFTFKTFSTMGRKMCIKKCLNYPSCLSINFERAHLKCELIQFSSEVNSLFLLEESGFEHIIINKTNTSLKTEKKSTSLPGKCNEINCEHVTTRSGQSFCLQEGIRSAYGNFAQNKSVASSSVFGDDHEKYSPMRLTDGDQRAINPFCAATKPESNPWMRIDLGYTYQIDHVLVFKGWFWDEPCQTYEVRVGATTTWNDMTSCGEGLQARNETIVCKDCLLGRYVQLQLKSTNSNCYIVLCEMEVIAAVV
ncbi:uncharacterized protein LOC133178452 [Saccostrea echinata]|uniref:uncharacterized protein LOC133178452 n=1 Tax=Saccostrea echinata TaxID=191078 RepID=UPI002A83CB85|nr:uncharacterized protein LOC133178452 [Saccostrea echinata]